MTNSGTATIGGVQAWGVGTTFTNTAGNSTFLSDAGSVTSSLLSISVTGGTTTFMASQHLSGLSVSPGAVADITNTSIRINYGSAANDPVAAIVASLTTGYAGGAWTGTGIVSTTAAGGGALPILSVGYNDGNADPGDSAAANQILIRYTLAGDANLDGLVNFADLLVVAQDFNKTGNDWAHGNFTYNGTGTVNFGDLLIVAQNFNRVLTPAGQSSDENGGSTVNVIAPDSAVPEPAGATVLVITSAGVLCRRRRRR
jgi:hypothetical protein